MSEITPSVIINTLDNFNRGFKQIRHVIEAMEDDQLIELYERAKEVSNVSWLIRCLVLGTAKKRAVRGDGTVQSLAQAFRITPGMAEIDIRVYETFIEKNEDFDPVLPAVFYQIASRADDPESAIVHLSSFY